MSWTQPKLDWKPVDYYSVADLRRVADNLLYLRTSATNLLGATFEQFGDIDTSAGTLTIPYVSTINWIETRLQLLWQAIDPEHAPTAVQWYARTSDSYVRNPNYQDWTRWEQQSADLRQAFINHTRTSIVWMCNEIQSGEV